MPSDLYSDKPVKCLLSIIGVVSYYKDTVQILFQIFILQYLEKCLAVAVEFGCISLLEQPTITVCRQESRSLIYRCWGYAICGNLTKTIIL